MIFYLILSATFGMSVVGQYDSEDGCKTAALAYIAMLDEHKSDDKHGVKLSCVGIPPEMPAPAESGQT